MFLLRLRLPDRPGSLGAVASALGGALADIHAVEIIEKNADHAVDDFVVELPTGVQPDRLVSACAAVPGVEVLWLSFYPSNWGLHADVEAFDAIAEHPDQAADILLESAPAVFRVTWAALVDLQDGRVLGRTGLAPETETFPTELLPDAEGVADLPAEWLPGWPETLVAAAPVGGSRRIVIARTGGPAIRTSELARLRYLAALAQQSGD